MEQKLNFIKHLNWLHNKVPSQNWIIGGDFNIISSLNEKKGGIRRLDRDSASLQTLIWELKLADIQTTNGLFTWNNRRGGEVQVAFRLDHFLTSPS